jgi:GT2 family glycosyltransferase
MLSIVIPVHNCYSFTRDLLDDFLRCDTKPESIIIIDNASDDDTKVIPVKYRGRLPIKYIRNSKNIGVNQAWMQGYKEVDTEYIGFWNNDIRICDFIIEAIEDVFRGNKDIGLVVPETINEDFLVKNAVYPRPLEFDVLGNREGWCFSMRKNIIDEGGKIPSELINSAGDDWLYNITNDLGYRAVKLSGVPIKHWGSATISDLGGWVLVNESLSPDDQKYWKKIKRKKKWN